MKDAASEAIDSGLAAWTRGDLDVLEQVLDPQVTLKAVEPGPWDCESRDEVMALLRLRESRRPPDQPRDVRVIRRDEATSWCRGWAAALGRPRW